MPPAPAPAGAKSPVKGSSGSWVQKHKVQVGAGAVAGVGGLALYRKSHASKAAAAPATTTIAPGATSVQPSANNSTASDMYNSLFDALSAQLASQSAGAGSPISTLNPATAPGAVAPPAVVAPAPPPGATVTYPATPNASSPVYNPPAYNPTATPENPNRGPGGTWYQGGYGSTTPTLPQTSSPIPASPGPGYFYYGPSIGWQQNGPLVHMP